MAWEPSRAARLGAQAGNSKGVKGKTCSSVRSQKEQLAWCDHPTAEGKDPGRWEDVCLEETQLLPRSSGHLGPLSRDLRGEEALGHPGGPDPRVIGNTDPS